MRTHSMLPIGCWVVAILASTWAVADERRDPAATELTVIVGAAGTDEYQEMFSNWVSQWKQVAENADVPLVVIGESEENTSDFEILQNRMQSIQATEDASHWVILIGHGTHDSRATNFNLRGPDVSAKEFAKWIQRREPATDNSPSHGSIVIVNCASSSGPFVNALSGQGRVIVTATQSGSEQNFARFGKYFADAMRSTESDLDHDDEVSVLEAFLSASKQTQRFYETESRIATEHALIDDNGDGRGTRAETFRGTRAIAKAKDGARIDGNLARRITLAVGTDVDRVKPDPLTKEQIVTRDQLEMQVEALRTRKGEMSEADYYAQLEGVMVQLAEIYHGSAE
ncbi:hypothetical protein [Aporhodopirellula aestuarii]|uniref:Uncharacterized protein n=1 Tax=Aporhodopirellula aestuarii TaxID=2950107 RepID=A0ABT0TZ97_9BACT|nr:hypothetical protein [Aporhodopirellula aestuarii]MCM2369931.1 hypothetical protein [Aporhodopirellula aestuarii]